MKRNLRVLAAAFAVSLLFAGTAAAFQFTTANIPIGQLDPWPATSTTEVVQFEARVGNRATDGVWELGHSFQGNYLDTGGQAAWKHDINNPFTLTHNSTTGDLTLSINVFTDATYTQYNTVSTTWHSGRKCQKIKEIWVMVKSGAEAYTTVAKKINLNGQNINTNLSITNRGTEDKRYLKIYNELFGNFTLTGEMNFNFSPYNPGPIDLAVFFSVVFEGGQDADGDGIGDTCDTCPNDFNNDADADGVCGNIDNCPSVSNNDQADCNANGIGNACDAINPDATELCDNIDNNCNGSKDENLTQATSCGVGACTGNTGIATCTTGVWGGDTCDPLAGATAETCDNVDNNCNGSIDENLTQQTTCGVGECGATGIETCTAGVWGGDTCTQGTPSAELCDNLDNNCDGAIDENLFRDTTCGVGACAGNTGEETCAAGVWGGDTCDPLAGATAESCDNVDNNCDGAVDEDLTRFTSCGTGECTTTVGENCIDGIWTGDSCIPGSPAAEICGDGLDQNCDGRDDGCSIQAKYDASLDDDTIYLEGVVYAEETGLILDKPVNVRFAGIYDTQNDEIVTTITTLAAGPVMTISNGSLITENIILK